MSKSHKGNCCCKMSLLHVTCPLVCANLNIQEHTLRSLWTLASLWSFWTSFTCEKYISTQSELCFSLGFFFYYVFMALLLNIFGCVINLSLPTTKNKVKVLLEKAAAVKGENFTSERNLKILLPWTLFVLLNELGIFSRTVGLYL